MTKRGVMQRVLAWIFILASAAGASVAAAADAGKPVLVFGAASLTDVLDDLGHAFTGLSQVEVKSSLAASSVLAKQIEAGAPADVFISADLDWMDYL
ncbi:MAG TPA: substrate-binding domain-containing protein, partial [Steroidobacteraceae bacterium]